MPSAFATAKNVQSTVVPFAVTEHVLICFFKHLHLAGLSQFCAWIFQHLPGRLTKATFLVLLVLDLITLAPHQAQAQIQTISPQYGPENTLGDQSDSDLWRAIRQGTSGLPSSSAIPDGVLINAKGTWWSELRRPEGPLIRYGSIALGVILTAVMLFFLIRGRLQIDGGRSGTRVARFSLAQRVVHWGIAALFLLLGVTGLILLFGRPFLIPLIGKPLFGIFATASMQAHNLFGPLFIGSLIALFFTFVQGNFPRFSDLKWIARAGGMFGGHASSGRYNAGEKAWFWTATLAGIALSVSGIIMSFPNDLATRDVLHLAELSHAIAALVFIGFGIGHIYLGTIGSDGALEGMITGDVDQNWARTHHDLWLAEIDAVKSGTQT